MWNAIQPWLEQIVVPMLRGVLDPWHAFLNALPPPVWRLAVCAYLVLGCVWVVFLSRGSVFAGAPSQSRWRDLRWWVPVLLLPYLLVYLIF
jgi:hypothetical protein